MIVKFAQNIIRHRFWWMGVILALTIFMGTRALRTSMSYELARVLPPNDSDFIAYQDFKKLFGEDGNLMVIGFKSDSLFQPEVFNDWANLEQEIKKINGISQTMSLPSVIVPVFNEVDKKISTQKCYDANSDVTADSLHKKYLNLKGYHGLLYNPKNNATLMAITFSQEMLNSKDRNGTANKIKELALAFGKKHNQEIHLSGMPYIRTEYMQMVSGEMKLFLVLALLVTALIIIAFFRSLTLTLSSILILGIEVIWAMGTMDLLGYKISILSGMLPALVIIISIPNSIFLINKYYGEYNIHGNKAKALIRIIQKVWFSLLLANVTTAIGFGVFYFTKSIMLEEFGIVASISIMATFLITMIMVPIMLSFLPAPSQKRAEHLQATRTSQFLEMINYIVLNHRKAIYITLGLMTLLGAWGMTKITLVGHVVDDLPEKHTIYSDLKFFEKEFGGVLPFEIAIDTKEKNGLLANGGQTFYKIQALQRQLKKFDELSSPISLTEGIKFINQAYKGGDKKYYNMPSPSDLSKLSQYLKGTNNKQTLFSSFIDTTARYTRISYRMNDVGSVRMKELVDSIKPKVDSIFTADKYHTSLTGLSLVYLKNNDYLLNNLFESLLIEVLLIALVGMILFKSVRIILLSKLPCLIPLVITAGIMGFFGVDFKATTILIFTIAFGLSSDGTIYFLTRFRHEFKQNNRTIEESISITIRDTGLSMIYTALVLFFGFIIFAASSFGGTKALGWLVSTTLLVSMMTNLVLLPSILLSLKKHLSRHKQEEELIDVIEVEE
jgi:predicted RND superfamily exporter protein